MSKFNFFPKPQLSKKLIPFKDTEEAWFWYVRSERARREGALSLKVESIEGRPCDPDDIYRFVMQLYKRKKLNSEHLRVLAEFGWKNAPPDPRVSSERRTWAIWGEALDKLSTILKSKGIVDIDDMHCRLQS